MALPPAAPHRQLRHRRSIDVQVFACGQGLWEVDARLVDVKALDVKLAAATRRAGDPIHEMLLRLVIDERFNVIHAGSETQAMPYQGLCGEHGDAYGRLVGLNLLKNFRRDVRERLSGILGCTHLTELTQVLPTAVVQAFAGDVWNTHESLEGSGPPLQINRCHALREDGPAVKTYYPRWYRPAPSDTFPTAA